MQCIKILICFFSQGLVLLLPCFACIFYSHTFINIIRLKFNFVHQQHVGLYQYIGIITDGTVSPQFMDAPTLKVFLKIFFYYLLRERQNLLLLFLFFLLSIFKFTAIQVIPSCYLPPSLMSTENPYHSILPCHLEQHHTLPSHIKHVFCQHVIHMPCTSTDGDTSVFITQDMTVLHDLTVLPFAKLP